eukprot:1997907-Lingulodinium_polyedra.AAC.1
MARKGHVAPVAVSLFRGINGVLWQYPAAWVDIVARRSCRASASERRWACSAGVPVPSNGRFVCVQPATFRGVRRPEQERCSKCECF